MRGGTALGGMLVGVLLAATPSAALAQQPPSRQAPLYPVYQPYRPYPPAPIPAVPRPQLMTVDHPGAASVGAIDSGPRSSGRVALTFDADMTPGMLQQLRSGQVGSWYNREVREILDSEQVRATIFLTGLWTLAYPEEARALAADPLFEIGNHTWDHAAFRVPCYGLAEAGDRSAEIVQSQERIRAVTGVTPRLIRFPGDCYDATDAALAAAQGLQVVSGDVRGGDAFARSAAAVAGNVLARLQPGSIVVLHIHGGANAPMTAPALRLVIQAVRERGLGFATVSELVAPAPVAAPRPPLEVARSAPLKLSVLGAGLAATPAAASITERALAAPRAAFLRPAPAAIRGRSRPVSPPAGTGPTRASRWRLHLPWAAFLDALPGP